MDSPNELATELASIEQQASTQLQGAELELILGASDIALSSGTYWDEHHNQWKAVCLMNPGACMTPAPTSWPDSMLVYAEANACGWKVLIADIVGFLFQGPWGALFASGVLCSLRS